MHANQGGKAMRRFLEVYNEELRFLHVEGSRFAQEYPQVAGHLASPGSRIHDPFVERLLEGAAFLTSRVQQRLDLEQSVFAEHMLARLAPDWMTPTPSMGMVVLEPDFTSTHWGEPARVPAGALITLRNLAGEGNRVKFMLRRDIALMPLELRDVHYGVSMPDHGHGLSGVTRGAGSCLRLTLSTRGVATLASLDLSSVTLTVCDDEVRGNRLFNLLAGRVRGVMAWCEEASTVLCSAESVSVPALEGEGLLPRQVGELPGTGLLREYFASPGLFRTVELTGFAPCVRAAPEAHQLHLAFILDGVDAALLDKVESTDLHLFAAPAVNLHSVHCAPLPVDDRRSEHPLLVDRLRPDRFQVHSIASATAVDHQGATWPCLPLYGTVALEPDAGDFRYEVRMRRSGSLGAAEIAKPYITVSPPRGTQRAMPRTLLVRAMVCNPALDPSTLKASTLELDQSRPVRSIAFLGMPSQPRPIPDASRAWAAVQAVHANPLAHHAGGDAAGAITHWLSTIADADDPKDAARIASIRRAGIIHHFVPAPGRGPMAWVREAKVQLDLSSHGHGDEGAYLFALVLRAALAGYADLNQLVGMALSIDGRLPVCGAPRGMA